MRSLGLLSAGVLIATIAAAIDRGFGTSEARAPSPIALWAADRDGHRLFALDSSLIRVRTIPCRFPTAVRCCRDGSVWVLRAENGGPDSRVRLERRSTSGEILTAVALDACIDLELDDDDDALVIETRNAAHRDRVRCVRKDGSLISLFERDGLTCLSRSHGSIALGTSDGDVLRIDSDGSAAIRGEAHVGGHIGDLAPGPDVGMLWALDVGGAHRLTLLEEDLRARWSIAVDLSAAHVAPVPGEERVWLCDTFESRVRRFGSSGALELDVSGLPLSGLDRATSWPDRGLVLTAPGALLHLDESGHLKPGQGGFNYLIDLDRAR